MEDVIKFHDGVKKRGQNRQTDDIQKRGSALRKEVGYATMQLFDFSLFGSPHVDFYMDHLQMCPNWTLLFRLLKLILGVFVEKRHTVI